MDVHNNDGSPLFDLCLMSTLAIFQLYNGKVCGIYYHYYINLVKKIGALQKNDKLLINYLNIYFQITNSFQHIITMETAVLQQKSIAWSDMRPKSASTDHTEETYGFRPSKPRPK